jgi:hypothetical protein
MTKEPETERDRDRRSVLLSFKCSPREIERLKELQERLPMGAALTTSGLLRELLRRGIELVEGELTPKTS